MIFMFNPLSIICCSLSLIVISPAFAQSEQWQHHTTKKYSTSPEDQPVYYKKPALKPAKKNMNNPLRRQGWHTAPDPYIEKGGVYTNKIHPAVTQHGQSLHNYSNGSPNSFVNPPSAVTSPYRNSSRQQAVQIENPIPGNVAPIPLPPIKP